MLGIDEATIRLYLPLLLPLGLKFGGFIFLAAGLAPAGQRREGAAEPVAKMSPAVATLMQKAVATAPKRGSRAYYPARLQRDHPAIAARVAAGELSVYKASIKARLRKAPAKAGMWTKADTYMKPASVTA